MLTLFVHHVAIMSSRLGYIEKILSGQKTIESRWYQTRRDPWNKIKVGDIVFFKDSGCPVIAKATVTAVHQFDHLSPSEVRSLIAQYGREITGCQPDVDEFYASVEGKNYIILISLSEVQSLSPICINKAGFGTGCAWITIPNISQIQKNS